MRIGKFQNYFLIHGKEDFLKRNYNFSDTISSHGGISKKIFIVYALIVNGTLSQKFHPNSTLTG